MAQQVINPEYTVDLLGDGGVGKRTWVKQLLTTCKRGVPGDQHRLVFYTNRPNSTITFNIRVLPNGGYSYHNYAGGDAAIIMFDVTSRITYKNIPNWHRDVQRDCGDSTPFALVGNKVDVKDRKMNSKQIQFHRKVSHMAYFDLSAKASYQVEKPWLWLARKLTGDNELLFVDTPPEVVALRSQVVSLQDEVARLRDTLVGIRQAVYGVLREAPGALQQQQQEH